MLLLTAALIVAAAIAWAALTIARAIASSHEAASRERTIGLLDLFAPSLGAADADPRALLVWQPLARAARRLFPDEFKSLDAAAGAPFPFGKPQLDAAHSRWTAEWLAWERNHDAEFKLKAAAESAAVRDLEPSLARARLEGIEREKLERYQRRYEEYIRVGKALQALQEQP